jgi:hypothetical protein
MSDKRALAPAEKKRAELYKEMTPQCREVAKDFDGKLQQSARGTIMIQYDMGARMAQVMDDEATYGSNAAENLAAYLAIRGGATTLYSLRTFADTFDKEFVKLHSNKPMLNGDYLSIGHWFQLMKLAEKSDQEKFLKRVINESLSSNELEREIRAHGGKKHKRQGGRNPSKPTSVLAGLQQTFQVANKFVRLEDVMSKHVFDAIDEIAADKVTPDLLTKLETVAETLGKAGKWAEKALKHVEKNKERVQRMLVKKEAADAKAKDEDKAAAKADKKAGKKKKKKGKNLMPDKAPGVPGPVPTGKKKSKKKKEKKKRQMAVVE